MIVMTSKFRSIMIVAFIFLLSSLNQHLNAQDIKIKNVHILDVIEDTILKNMDLVIQDGIITIITPSSNSGIESSDQLIIDGTGNYVVPGFINTHVHNAMGEMSFKIENQRPVLKMNIDSTIGELTCALLLENGITTARDPGGKTSITTKMKEDIENGIMRGPEFLVAGSILDTTRFIDLVATVNSKKEIIQEINSQFDSGVDFIKLYTSLSPEMLKIAVETSHNLGIETIAHLHNTSWTEASTLGIDNIVHILPGHHEYLPERFQKQYLEVSKLGSKGFYKWFEYVDLDSPKIDELINTMALNNTSLDPTLIMFHSIFFGNQKRYTENPRLDRLPENVVKNWRMGFNFTAGWTEKDFMDAQRTWVKVQIFLKKIFDGGILITSGTDANNPWIVPGTSFHDELLLLSECGISNAEVLKIATINGAELLKLDDKIGSIEIGKEADIVLLNSNPLEDIRNTRDIKAVILNGRVIRMN